MFVGLLLIVELFNRIDEFIERQVFWSDAVYYMLLKLPGIVSRMLPAALLLASVLTFSTLTKYNEITAIRASGIAPLRLAWPLFLLGGVGCVVLLVVQEDLLPSANQTYRLIWRTRISYQKLAVQLGMFRREQIWYHAESRVWNVELSKPLENQLLGVTIYELDTTRRIRRRYDAAEAHWEPQGWVLRRGTLRVFGEDGLFAAAPEDFVQRRVDFPERPTDISALQKELDEMGLRELLAHARRLRRHGLPDSLYLTEFHGKLALAAVCILMAGFGAPLALHLNRSGGTIRALGLMLCCGFSYWVLHSLAMALGQNGHLPPVLAAWGTNCCFGVGCVYFSFRSQ
jgi:lipopolysaccharide export system permease protein